MNKLKKVKKHLKSARIDMSYHKKQMEYHEEVIKILEKYIEDNTMKVIV